MATDLELTAFPTVQSIFQDDLRQAEVTAPSNAASALPKTDTSREAWLFLLGATMTEMLVWGVPYSIGVLTSFWQTELFPPGTPGTGLISLAGTLASGLLFAFALLVSPIHARYPHQRVPLQLLGIAISFAGIVGAGFATKPWHLLLTFGLMFPFSSLFYMPAATLLFEWFSSRRGTATGIMYSGTGAGGTVYPLIMHGLLQRFSYKAAMVALGTGYGVLCLAALPLIRRRVPLAPHNSHEARLAQKLDFGFLKHSPFYAFSAAIVLTSFGSFTPALWVPTYALDLKLSDTDGTILVTAMNAASIPGLLLMGFLSDRWPPRVVLTLTCLGPGLACLFLWGFATDIGLLAAFVVVFGFLSESFTSIWSKLITMIVGDNTALPQHVFGYFSLLRGIGNIAIAPISNKLLAMPFLAGGVGGYGVSSGGRNYGSLLLFTGLTFVAGSVAGVIFREEKRSEQRS